MSVPSLTALCIRVINEEEIQALPESVVKDALLAEYEHFRYGEEDRDYYVKMGRTKVDWWANGQRHWVQHWDNGKKVGKWEWWFSNAQRWRVEHWDNGVKVGAHEEWYENGQERSVEHWYKGTGTGIWEWWYEDGARLCVNLGGIDVIHPRNN